MRSSFRTRRPVVLMAFVLLAAACEPPERTSADGPVNAWVWAYDEGTHKYGLRKEPLPNLESLRALRGATVDFRRGSRLVGALIGTSVELDRGAPFSLEYGIDADGTIVAADAKSLHALSLYRFLEIIAERLKPLGYEPVRRFDVLFEPRIDDLLLGDQRLLITDNAAYVSYVRAFLIVPSVMLSDFPLLLNFGVVAHEFGHGVIHELLFGDVPIEPFMRDDSDAARILGRHVQSMHEGVADLFGFGLTGEPNFILASADAERDMASPRDFTQDDYNAHETLPDPTDILGGLLSFEPHYHGSTLARAIYEAWPRNDEGRIDAAGRERLLRLTIAALRSLRDQVVPGEFTIVSFPNALVAQLEESERSAACAVLKKRFLPLSSRFSACLE